ncbi:MAG: hypothetical protein ACKVK0_18115, partial [Pirellulales bacterium]
SAIHDSFKRFLHLPHLEENLYLSTNTITHWILAKEPTITILVVYFKNVNQIDALTTTSTQNQH